MACRITKKICPVIGAARDVFVEMVEDQPWVWTGLSLVVGLFLGRYGFFCSCCKKKAD